MEHHGREEMDSKEESPQVWPDSAEQEQNTAQVTSAFQSSWLLLKLNLAWCGGLASRRSNSAVFMVWKLSLYLRRNTNMSVTIPD